MLLNRDWADAIMDREGLIAVSASSRCCAMLRRSVMLGKHADTSASADQASNLV